MAEWRIVCYGLSRGGGGVNMGMDVTMNHQMQFKLPIGAKRQVTLPRAFMEMMSLEEGGELLLEVEGDRAILTPMVSVPRTALPEELRARFESRRGQKASDVPLAGFLPELKGKVASPAPARPDVSTAAADQVQAVPVYRNVEESETI